MRWILFSAIVMLASATSGCVTSHPRPSPGLDKIVGAPQRIAILKPDLDTRVKYINTPEFFFSKSRAELWATNIVTGVRRGLEDDHHKIFHYTEIDKMLPRGRPQAALLTRRLVDLTEPAIESDADYSKGSIPILITAEGLIPPQLAEQVDLIVAIKGHAKIETVKEFYARWFRNIGLNLLTFPISLASAFIPVPIPLSVTISTSIFEPNPEDVFVSLIVVDTKTSKIVFQNDYYTTYLPGDDTEFQEMGLALINGMRRKDFDLD